MWSICGILRIDEGAKWGKEFQYFQCWTCYFFFCHSCLVRDIQSIIIHFKLYLIFPPMLLNWSLQKKMNISIGGSGVERYRRGTAKMIQSNDGLGNSDWCPWGSFWIYQSNGGLVTMIQHFCSSESQSRKWFDRWIWRDDHDDKSHFDIETENKVWGRKSFAD